MTTHRNSRRTRLAVAVAAAAATALTGVASADGPAGAGVLCGLTATTDPTGGVAQPGQWVGEVHGGPFAVADLATDDAVSGLTGNPASATVTCATQVNGTGRYTDPDAVSASASGTAVVTLPPTAVSFYAGGTDSVWLCATLVATDAHGESETLYFDDTTGDWAADPGWATCALAVSQDGTLVASVGSAVVGPRPPRPRVRADAFGHIVIHATSTGLSFTTSGVYQTSFNCGFTSFAPVTVDCTPKPSSVTHVDGWYCTYWILTATTTGNASVRGQSSCLGNHTTTLYPGDASTRDVHGTDSATSYSVLNYDINHDVTDVVCQAWGINGSTTPVGPTYTVNCFEPGQPATVG
jgi:hypothetical protein